MEPEACSGCRSLTHTHPEGSYPLVLSLSSGSGPAELVCRRGEACQSSLCWTSRLPLLLPWIPDHSPTPPPPPPAPQAGLVGRSSGSHGPVHRLEPVVLAKPNLSFPLWSWNLWRVGLSGKSNALGRDLSFMFFLFVNNSVIFFFFQ